MIIIASQIPASRVNNSFCFQFDNNENIKVPHWQPFAKKFHRSPADSPHKDSVMQEGFSMAWHHNITANCAAWKIFHYHDVIMGTIASQITSLTVVYSIVYSDADQRKHQSSASLAFVWGIHRDRWIPRTKGQLRGKCFHLMTSSCEVSTPSINDGKPR